MLYLSAEHTAMCILFLPVAGRFYHVSQLIYDLQKSNIP